MVDDEINGSVENGLRSGDVDSSFGGDKSLCARTKTGFRGESLCVSRRN